MARASSRSPSASRIGLFVHQNDRPLPGALVQRPYQVPETDRRPGGARFEAGQPFRLLQLVFHVSPNEVRRVEIAPAEADPHDGMARRPVPLAVHGEAPEQLLAPLEQLLQRVHQQGLAEPARARQEIVIAPFDEAAHMVRLVDVVAVHPPDLPERGKTGRKHASRHSGRVGHRTGVVKRKRLRRAILCRPPRGRLPPFAPPDRRKAGVFAKAPLPPGRQRLPTFALAGRRRFSATHCALKAVSRRQGRPRSSSRKAPATLTRVHPIPTLRRSRRSSSSGFVGEAGNYLRTETGQGGRRWNSAAPSRKLFPARGLLLRNVERSRSRRPGGRDRVPLRAALFTGKTLASHAEGCRAAPVDGRATAAENPHRAANAERNGDRTAEVLLRA